MAEKAREEVRSWIPTKLPFEPRPAPRLEEVLREQVRARTIRPSHWVLEDEQDEI